MAMTTTPAMTTTMTMTMTFVLLVIRRHLDLILDQIQMMTMMTMMTMTPMMTTMTTMVTTTVAAEEAEEGAEAVVAVVVAATMAASKLECSRNIPRFFPAGYSLLGVTEDKREYFVAVSSQFAIDSITLL
jgi:hypothetical protein